MRIFVFSILVGLAAACGSTSNEGSPEGTDGGGPDASAASATATDGGGGADACTSCDAGSDAAPPRASRLLLFGGFVQSNGNFYLGDTWEWTGTTWSPRSTTGPAGRVQGAVAARSGRAILFGGYNGVALADTWEWDGNTWLERNVAGPSARWGAAMTGVGGKVVLFGGFDGAGAALEDTWEWDGVAWTKRNVSGPKARKGAAMTESGGKAILYGGESDISTWEWDGTGWRELGERGAISLSRAGLSMTTTAKGKVFAIGGTYASGCYSDVQEWTPPVWTNLGAPGIDASRCGATAAAFGDDVILFGGSGYPNGLAGGHQYLADTWRWNGTAWSKLADAGPPKRDRHMLVQY